jgi:hypothetical protein
MKMRLGLQRLAIWALALLFASAAMAQDKTFKQEQLDQILAPVALYPDALLSQVLMASTYPVDVAAAAKWSKDHLKDKEKGDELVKKVDGENWDPAVKSLVAFPSVLGMMGDKPDWTKELGDAFLAQPDDVMNTIQGLRKRAQDQGNLKTNEQQKVVVEQQKIIIEPTQPQTVYVPAYNPTVVYGPWWYPSYPAPFYWYPTPYYAPYYGFGAVVATGIAWGVAIGVGNAMWGGIGWGNNDVNINVNKYNNVNANNKINNASGNTKWNHNGENRKGAPYRDNASREKYDNRKAGADGRQDYRGKTDSRDADRARADQAMRDRGVDTGRGGAGTGDRAGDKAGDRAGDRTGDRAGDRAGDRPGDRGGAGGPSASTRDMDRGGGAHAADRSSPAAGNRDSAFSGAGNAAQTRQSADRGHASSAANRGGSAAARPQPAARSAPAARPSGGASRGGGGGGRGGGGRR